jgi:nickel-dependent lactate racemase
VMEADRIILTGEIMYHLIAGYSGGRKSVAPGVAGWRTTTFNHRMIFEPRCESGILDGNPAHEDLLEACRLVDPDFLVNVVLTPDGKLARVVAGHYEKAHREGCKTVDELLCAPVEAPYDLLIASAGGFPLDIDLRQAHKGLENACRALRAGGTILFYAECANGSGHPLFDDYVKRFAGDQEMKRALLEKFEVGGHKAYWVAKLGRLFDIHLVSELPDDFVERCHLQPVRFGGHAERLRELVRRAGPAARIAVIPHAGHTLPRIAAQAAL